MPLYLSFGALLVGRVHEDPSVGDGAVDVGHHGADVASSVRSAAVLQEKKERFRMCLSNPLNAQVQRQTSFHAAE